jgi:hypothetical protein
MADVVKTAMKAGHPRYTPIDVTSIPFVPPPSFEPGRLEARLSEFYKKAETIATRTS